MLNFDKYIDIAKAMKVTYQEHSSFHVAFIIKGGVLYNIATNTVKANSISSTYISRKGENKGQVFTAGIHAEIKCVGGILHRDYNLNKFSMVVIRIDNNGKIANSCPCLNCQTYLRGYGFKRIYFSNANGEIEKMKI